MGTKRFKVMEGQKALRFYQKYLHLCSKDEQKKIYQASIKQQRNVKNKNKQVNKQMLPVLLWEIQV